jgi:ABC-type multidrug transport system ATPase subunit
MSSSGLPLLRVDRLSKRLGNRKIFDEVSFEVDAGTIVGISGPRGSGKRKLLDVITGNERADAGRIVFDGHDVTSTMAAGRRRLGMASSLYEPPVMRRILESWRPGTVEQRLRRAHKDVGSSHGATERDALIGDTLSMLDLHPYRTSKPHSLSAGLRQRALLGELLIGQPKLIVLDEPLKVLDEQTREPFLALLRGLAERTHTSVLLSDRSGHASRACNKLYFLEQGRLQAKDNAISIFINYRRGEDAGYAQALYQQLETAFERRHLFMDVEGNITPGADFTAVLRNQVQACDILLVVIGSRWADAVDDRGHRRLDEVGDWVRVEIVSALEAGKHVVPVLVGAAEMPREEDLPGPLRPLCRRQAVRLNAEGFRSDAQRLVRFLQSLGR